MQDPKDKAPELIVDSDWKNQAQAEKDRLAEQEAKHPEKSKGRGAPGPGELPPADFQTLVGMLATQAIMYLGGIADRQTGQAIFDPEYSRHMIDLLATLQEKTKGNLSKDEELDLTQLLHELRARYVELSTMLAHQAAQGGVKPGGPISPGGAVHTVRPAP